jgi:hypothetical protein
VIHLTDAHGLRRNEIAQLMNTPTATTTSLMRLAYQLVRVMSMFLAVFPAGRHHRIMRARLASPGGRSDDTHTHRFAGCRWTQLG